MKQFGPFYLFSHSVRDDAELLLNNLQQLYCKWYHAQHVPRQPNYLNSIVSALLFMTVCRYLFIPELSLMMMLLITAVYVRWQAVLYNRFLVYLQAKKVTISSQLIQLDQGLIDQLESNLESNHEFYEICYAGLYDSYASRNSEYSFEQYIRDYEQYKRSYVESKKLLEAVRTIMSDGLSVWLFLLPARNPHVGTGVGERLA